VNNEFAEPGELQSLVGARHITWAYVHAGSWKAHDDTGLIVGRVCRVSGRDEYDAWANGDFLGIYISEQTAKAAVEKKVRR
jgi:hypothetical protein